jgi:purine-binding chemotaxis protein CheW
MRPISLSTYNFCLISLRILKFISYCPHVQHQKHIVLGFCPSPEIKYCNIFSPQRCTMQSTPNASDPVQFLAFTMGEEEYGLDIIKVQEIRGYEAVTRLANAPNYFKGVINLRGVIVPVIDMRIKLDLGTPTYDQFTIVIVLNIKGNVMGMVVDGVSDVMTLTPDQIRPAPELSNAMNTKYLIGLGTVDERMLILINIDKLMTSDGTDLLEKLAA